MNIFHITTSDSWASALAAGSYQPESLAAEGFIHFSYAEQVAATANRYYRDVDGLHVLEVDPALLAGDLLEEPSPATGELFPHLYGPLSPQAVVAVRPLLRSAAHDYVF